MKFISYLKLLLIKSKLIFFTKSILENCITLKCLEGNRFERWKWTVLLALRTTMRITEGIMWRQGGCWVKANRGRLPCTSSVCGQGSTTETVICSILSPEVTSLSREQNHSRPLIFAVRAVGSYRAPVCQNRGSIVAGLILTPIPCVGFGVESRMDGWMDGWQSVVKERQCSSLGTSFGIGCLQERSLTWFMIPNSLQIWFNFWLTTLMHCSRNIWSADTQQSDRPSLAQPAGLEGLKGMWADESRTNHNNVKVSQIIPTNRNS